MKKHLFRILLTVALLCGPLGSGTRVRAFAVTRNDQQKSEEQMKQNDRRQRFADEVPLCPMGAALRSMPSSHRVASSRSARLLPTFGGKPGQQNGHGAANGLSNLLKHVFLQLCRDARRPRIDAASPRLYYVIALRRILC